jgi:hypothetical protein
VSGAIAALPQSCARPPPLTPPQTDAR